MNRIKAKNLAFEQCPTSWKKEYLEDVIDEVYDTIKQKIDDVVEEQKRGKNWSEQCAINAIAEKLKEELL